MNNEKQARQDQSGDHKPVELTFEEDESRIENLKASKHSHHTAGGCAELTPKPVKMIRENGRRSR